MTNLILAYYMIIDGCLLPPYPSSLTLSCTLSVGFAAECNATFFNIRSSDIGSKWIGESEKTVKVRAVTNQNLAYVLSCDGACLLPASV